jgi:hypothetical protein
MSPRDVPPTPSRSGESPPPATTPEEDAHRDSRPPQETGSPSPRRAAGRRSGSADRGDRSHPGNLVAAAGAGKDRCSISASVAPGAAAIEVGTLAQEHAHLRRASGAHRGGKIVHVGCVLRLVDTCAQEPGARIHRSGTGPRHLASFIPHLGPAIARSSVGEGGARTAHLHQRLLRRSAVRPIGERSGASAECGRRHLRRGAALWPLRSLLRPRRRRCV